MISIFESYFLFCAPLSSGAYAVGDSQLTPSSIKPDAFLDPVVRWLLALGGERFYAQTWYRI